MKVGVVFPQTEIGTDPGAIREYAQAAESLGYDHILAYDHVLGADADYYGNWTGAYRLEDQFHEPFVLFGYLAGLTKTIGFTTGIIILPQRQAVLVAKQAAALDVLSGGRLRLGIGIGWNQVEYEALGENFRNRGRRSEEQIALMRELWTKEVVTFEGKWNRVIRAGLNPLPVQRPIPVWFGGGSEQVLKRIGETGDGWITTTRQVGLNDAFRGMIERIHGHAREAGRDPSEIGIEGTINAGSGSPEDWADAVAEWGTYGATHITLNTMNSGYETPEQHIEAISQFREVTG